MMDFGLITGVGASESSMMLFANESMSLDDYSNPSLPFVDDADARSPYNDKRPPLLARMSKRLSLYLDQLVNYLESQFNEHTATTIAVCCVLIVVLTTACCFITSLARKEELRIKEQYKKLRMGSSQSSILINSGRTSLSTGSDSQGGAQSQVAQAGNGDQRQRCDAQKSQRIANMSMSSATSLGKNSAGNGGACSYYKDSFSIFHGSGSGGDGDTSASGRYQKIVDQQSSLDSEQALLGAEASTVDGRAAPTSKASPSSHHHHHHHRHQIFHNLNHSQHNINRRPNSRHYDLSKSPIDNSSGHSNHQHQKQDNKVRLHELRRETYFGLVRLSKPGCRTIVLLCDAQSRAKLLRKFYQCVYPYRKNKTLQFAFLLIERNIGWYKDLLKSALSDRRYLRINPINCIGTVLVLNGFKKFYSVYHASNSRWSPEYEEPPSLLLEEALLDNLPEWLERVFAGKVNRYYVESWPDRVQYTY